MPSLLIIDDDRLSRKALCAILGNAGYEVREANGCDSAVARFRERQPDLVLLDVVMPGKDGFETFKELRKISRNVPILFLTSMAGEETEVKGFSRGADDYINKEKGDGVLLARVSRALARPGAAAANIAAGGGDGQGRGNGRFFVGNALVDLEHSCLKRKDGTRVGLSQADKDILTVLSSHRGRYITWNEIVEEARGEGYKLDAGTVRAEIFRLKMKLGEDASRIKSARSLGYCLE